MILLKFAWPAAKYPEKTAVWKSAKPCTLKFIRLVIPFTFNSLSNVLLPANVWFPVVTIPPLFSSAGARFNSPAVIEAPFAFEEVLIAPTVVELPEETEPSAIKYWEEVPFGTLKPSAVAVPVNKGFKIGAFSFKDMFNTSILASWSKFDAPKTDIRSSDSCTLFVTEIRLEFTSCNCNIVA